MSSPGPVSSAQLPRPGDMIAGKYVLDRLLGQGGMGAVFAARHIKLSKAVAIKIMLADASSHEAAQRFINEGRAAANIQNEHVVRVDDVDEEMGYAYMVLELLDGEDLAQVLDREPTRRLQPHVAVGYVVQALAGVSQAHAIGIVHRDLKPSNLFLAKRKDGSVVVKVLDFGISKAQGSSALAASPSALTSTKAMLGSPLYMSPEQLRSSKSVDQRADIWAIGVILYELITGQLPFLGDNLGELFAAILETDPTPLRTLVPEVSPGLEQVVLRCLQRRPDQRFQTATALTEALAPFASPHPNAGGALGGTAMLLPGAAAAFVHAAPASPAAPAAYPPGGAATPSGARPGSMPTVAGSQGSGQQATGSGPRMAAAGVTPQGLMHQTASGWQSTGGTTMSVPKSKAPLLISAAIAGLLLVLGGVGVVFIVKSKGRVDPVVGSAGASVTAPPAVSSVPPPVTASLSVDPAPSPPASAPSSLAATGEPPPATTGKVGANVKPIKPSGPGTKVDPPKPPDPTPPPPSPPPTRPTAKPNDGNLQNAR